MSIFNSGDVLYSDVERCLTLPFAKKYGIAKTAKEIKKILRDARECQVIRENKDKITGVILFPVPYVELSLAIETARKKIKPSAKKPYIRNLEEYCYFDEYLFAGVIIHKPAEFFDDIICVKNNDRLSQTMVRYPDQIRNHIKKRASFYYLGSSIEGDDFYSGELDETVFNDLIVLTNKSKGDKYYFGVWK